MGDTGSALVKAMRRHITTSKRFFGITRPGRVEAKTQRLGGPVPLSASGDASLIPDPWEKGTVRPLGPIRLACFERLRVYYSGPAVQFGGPGGNRSGFQLFSSGMPFLIPILKNRGN
jgi:hypothetical protein